MSVKRIGLYMMLILSAKVYGQTAGGSDLPARPSILFNRWQEDWSALANPNVSREPLDNLKYIPL